MSRTAAANKICLETSTACGGLTCCRLGSARGCLALWAPLCSCQLQQLLQLISELQKKGV